jgi:hypothetical protein
MQTGKGGGGVEGKKMRLRRANNHMASIESIKKSIQSH